jgi:hypothetical protein
MMMNTVNNQSLSHYIIINEMMKTTGCTYEQATQLLISTEWTLQVLIFF